MYVDIYRKVESMDIAEIKTIVREKLKEIQPYIEFEDDTDLLEGVIDSIALLVLVSELEDAFDIVIELEEVTKERFFNINTIGEFMKSKVY